jgi:hypothetical protein
MVVPLWAGWYLSKTGGGAMSRKEVVPRTGYRQSIVVTRKRDGGISKHRG